MKTWDEFCVEAQRADLTADDYDLGKAVEAFGLCVGEEGHTKEEARAALLKVSAEAQALINQALLVRARCGRLLGTLNGIKEAP